MDFALDGETPARNMTLKDLDKYDDKVIILRAIDRSRAPLQPVNRQFPVDPRGTGSSKPSAKPEPQPTAPASMINSPTPGSAEKENMPNGIKAEAKDSSPCRANWTHSRTRSGGSSVPDEHSDIRASFSVRSVKECDTS
jgi:hypothetical protein